MTEANEVVETTLTRARFVVGEGASAVVPRRRLARLASAIGVLTALSAVLAAISAQTVWRSTPTAVRRGDRTASCVEQSGVGHSTGWFADYKISGPPDEAQIQVVSVRSATDGHDNRSRASQSWVLSWTAPGRKPASVTSDGAALPLHKVVAPQMDMLAPDGNCTLLLFAAQPPAHQVAVIGDSVFADVATTVAKAGPGVDPYAQSWHINANSGFGWGASPTLWPLGVVRGTWAIGLARGILPQQPSALVVELGVNDALRAVFADAIGDPALAREIRQGVMNNVSELLSQVSTHVPCTIIVTAPTHETQLFGSGRRYSAEAELIDAILRAQVTGTGGDKVLLADWAALSAPHHVAEGASGSWFTPGDDIHPNTAGQRALTSFVHSVIQTCPARPAHPSG